MKRPVILAAALALLAVACGGGGGGSGEAAPGGGEAGPIRVGVVGPMTGLAAFVGKNFVEGIQLAVEDINDGGGLLGRQVEYVVRDDEFDPAKTTTAVRELLERERVAALFGPIGTSNYLSAARVIEEAQVPAWVPVAGVELSLQPNSPIFRAYLPDTTQIEPLAKFAAKRYARIAVVAANDAEGQAFRERTAQALAAAGRKPVAVEAFAPDETDFTPLILKVKGTGAEAIVLGTHLGLYASRAAGAMKNLGYRAQILGLAGLINYTYPDLARDAADGTIFVSFRSWGHLPRDQWPAAVRSFYERYVRRFLPEGEFSATGAYRAYSTNFLSYDAVQIWAEAVRQARSADPRAVVKLLNAGFTFPAERSVIGVPWRYTSTNHDGIEPGELFFYRWDLRPDGKFTLTMLGSVTDVLAGRVRV